MEWWVDSETGHVFELHIRGAISRMSRRLSPRAYCSYVLFVVGEDGIRSSIIVKAKPLCAYRYIVLSSILYPVIARISLTGGG
jgi:hypothetical protein